MRYHLQTIPWLVVVLFCVFAIFISLNGQNVYCMGHNTMCVCVYYFISHSYNQIQFYAYIFDRHAWARKTIIYYYIAGNFSKTKYKSNKIRKEIQAYK